MNYTLHQLMVFSKIVETKSITKASEELHLTQPAVSIQLKNFQDQFEIPLTEIIGRKLYVTEFGYEIAAATERILNEVKEIDYKSMAFKGFLTGQLKITSVSTGKYVMPQFISDFLKLHQGVKLNLDVTNKSSVIKSLENNEVDFALVSVLPKKISVETVPLIPNKLFLIVDRNYTLTKEKYNKKIFKNLPIIHREEGSGTRDVMEAYMKEKGVSIKKNMELTSNEAVKQAVVAGLGASILPLIGLKNEIQNGDLKIVPMDDFPISTTWNLVWLKNKKLSPVAIAYLNYLGDMKDKIIHDRFGWYDQFLKNNNLL